MCGPVTVARYSTPDQMRDPFRDSKKEDLQVEPNKNRAQDYLWFDFETKKSGFKILAENN